MKRSENIAKLADALSKAQSEMENARKDKDNPFFKSTYADLASVWDACRGPLSKNGLSIMQPFDTVDGKIILTTQLSHSSGEWISSEVVVKPVKDDPQGYGSALTYYRRFALSSLVGVAPSDSDDDGNQANGRIMPDEENQSGTSQIIPKVILPIQKVEIQKSGDGSNLKKKESVPTPLSPQQSSNAANPGTNGERNKTQEDLVTKIKTEAAKIKTLRLELGISVEDLKAEVFEEFKTDDFSKLSYEQLVQITSMLQKEKVSRSSTSTPTSQQEAWLAPENHGPVGNTEFQN